MKYEGLMLKCNMAVLISAAKSNRKEYHPSDMNLKPLDQMFSDLRPGTSQSQV